MHIHSVRRAALAAFAFAVLLVTPAGAAGVATKLRVEAGGHDLGPGWRYAHDSIAYVTSESDACSGSGAGETLEGPTALGLLLQASRYTRRLRPVQISDQFDFGPFVCGVGAYESGDGFWLYKVDHVAPEVGAGAFAIDRSHEQVLWYFSNTANGANTGNELALQADDRVQAGRPTTVTVLEYAFDGASAPAEGARILNGGDATTDADGEATLVFDEPGRTWIRGIRGIDIPTDARRICVWEESESECDEVLLDRLVGTGQDDVLRGGDQPERILGRRGQDRIVSRGDGERDFVRCGRGVDRVRADQLDRVGRGCEKVRRK